MFIIDATETKYTNWNLRIIQLWHGTGFKNIGLLNDLNINNDNVINTLKKNYSKYKLVVATSVSDRERKVESFGVKNVVITGSPRNDIFFDFSITADTIKSKNNLNKYNEIISYTPTFRDFETFAPFSNRFWEKLNEYLILNNTLFIVKKHPWDEYLSIPNCYSNIKDMSNIFIDVQELLLITDILISDYSGIMTDFALTNKPIICFMYDWEEYANTCRTSYYDLSSILPKPFVYQEEELLDRIMSRKWLKEDQYIKSYDSFRNMFHKYLDNSSCKRVMAEITKITNDD